MKEMKKFEVGKSYEMRSCGDSDCVWRFTVISRTASTITIAGDLHNDLPRKTCRIAKRESEWDGAEAIFPLGRYSMCPMLSAEKVA